MRRRIALCMLVFVLAGCTNTTGTPASGATVQSGESVTTEETSSAENTSAAADTASTEDALAEETPAEEEKTGDIMILFTSDIHCGVDQGFGLAGLSQIRSGLEAQGYEIILVDNGDAIQGEPLGTVSKGASVIELMNAVGYDIAIPGNHEFDYGMERFLELTEQADFSYISCNFNREGETVFDPYIIKEVAGVKIGFVGVTTPKSITRSTPRYFRNEAGEYIYGFFQDDTGEGVYEAVQSAVDAARADGADFVYVLGHLGLEESCRPWTYADVIANTNGIDVFLDGHSHDTEQVVMKNKDGEDVVRSACGTKLNAVGYSHITPEGEIADTGIWSWPNKTSAVAMLGISNGMGDEVARIRSELDEALQEVVATTSVELTINDPEEKDESGNPIRMVRRAETNLGDLCADAYRDQGQADIGFVNGGGVRVSIESGDITYGDILNVHPFGNMLCVVEVTGQQILDALEWGTRAVPEESGSFPHVSGLTFELHVGIESGAMTDENGMCSGFKGERRVKNVMVGEEPLDPNKTYTLAGHEYMLLNNGDGYTAFEGATLLQERIKLDNQALMDYIMQTLDGTIGEDYADPYGQGRIVIIE